MKWTEHSAAAGLLDGLKAVIDSLPFEQRKEVIAVLKDVLADYGHTVAQSAAD